MLKNKKKFEVHIISHSHWDREWRYPFEETRIALVEMMDSVLDVLEKYPDYKYFHLDSQTAVLDDYLEIRPENKKRIEKLVKKGKLLIGPWYTLPEEFCISGESIVRNLMYGHKKAQEFGRVMKAGYTPTSFGQISQIAQIYKSFGIESILFYRGISRHECNTEYLLESPDGSRILGVRVAERFARNNFFVQVYRPVILNKWPFEWEYNWSENRLPFHVCDELSFSSNYQLLKADYLNSFYPENLKKALNNAINDIKDDSKTPYLLFWDGMDSTHPHPSVPKIIKEANKELYPYKFVHSSLPSFIDKIKEAVKNVNLQVLKGERRTPNKEGLWHNLFKDVISAHLYLKQQNRTAEFMLEKLAEPFSAVAWILGSEYPKKYLDIAWKYMFVNQAHDDISGCSVDEVHKNMVYRYSQVKFIADSLTRKALASIVSCINTGGVNNDIFLIIFNPLPFERTEAADAYVDIPSDLQFENLVLKDKDGNKIPVEIISSEKTYNIVKHPLEFPVLWNFTRYKISFFANAISSMGYKTYKVSFVPVIARSGVEFTPLWGGSNLVKQNKISMSPFTLENEFLKIKIKKNGTLTVTDKITRKIYNNCHYFEDCGEIGDPWTRKDPPKNEIITSLNNKAKINLIENNPNYATFIIKLEMKLPKSLNENKSARSSEKISFPVTSFVTLKKGSKYMEITTKIDNTVKDHRLRVVFSTGLNTEYSYAESSFDVVRREIKIPDTAGWVEQATGTNPELSFVDVYDGKIGIAILNQGLPEYEVIDNKKREIAITLLRGFRYPLIGADPAKSKEDVRQVNSQCPGPHEFKYAFYPHRGNWEQANIYNEAYKFNAGFKPVQCGKNEGILPEEASFLKIEPFNVVLSAFKKSENRNEIILRLFNPTRENLTAKVEFFKKIKKVNILNLNENLIRSFKHKDSNVLNIEIKKKKIMTLGVLLS